MPSNVDPSILAALDEERGAMASSGRNYRTLKLKPGESALARFLPVQMGAKKTWFARIARHWVNNRPVLCQRQTSPNFNGDPQATCPLCDLEAEFSQSRNKATSELARKMGAYPQILTYVFVFEITDDRGRPSKTPANELYIPNEYWLGRDAWKEIDALWRRSLEKTAPFGFLDPVHGYDFTISCDARKIKRHQREDPQPIDPDKSVEEMLEIIDKAFLKVKQPDTTPATEEELESIAEKARETLEGGSARGGGSSRRAASPVDRDADEVLPSRGRREEAAPAESRRRETPSELPPARSRTTETTARREPPPVDSDPQAGGDELPPPSRRSAEPPARRTAEAPARADRRSTVEQELDEATLPEPESAEDTPPPPVRSTGGTASPTRRQAPPPPARGSRIEEDPEQLPRERRDPAPPEEPAVPAAGTRAAASPAQGKLSEKMRNNMSRLGAAQL